jgi:hypothetical protein
MFVRQCDARDSSDIQPDSSRPALHLAGTESGIDQQRHTISLDSAAIPAGSRAQHVKRDHRMLR